MNIERSYFNACIIHDKFLFCLFGYNTPSNKYLDTIEFCDISNLSLYPNSNKWQYLNYLNNNSINMNICGFACINYFDEKIIVLGGINGIEKKPVDKIYKIYLDKNFFEGNENNYLEEIKEINDIYQNKCYYLYIKINAIILKVVLIFLKIIIILIMKIKNIFILDLIIIIMYILLKLMEQYHMIFTFFIINLVLF